MLLPRILCARQCEAILPFQFTRVPSSLSVLTLVAHPAWRDLSPVLGYSLLVFKVWPKSRFLHEDCFLISPLNSILKTVAIVFLWKCDWILSFFYLEASRNFSFQSRCQTPYNQQSVVYILVSCCLSDLFSYMLLCDHHVLAPLQSPCSGSCLLWCCAPSSLPLVFRVPSARKFSSSNIACSLNSIRSLFKWGLLGEAFYGRL